VVKKKDILEILKTVKDPEIPLDIVNLGLVDDVVVENKTVLIKMTLTTPKCPLEYLIKAMVINAVKGCYPDLDVNVVFSFDKMWNTKKISEEGKRKLKELGWNI